MRNSILLTSLLLLASCSGVPKKKELINTSKPPAKIIIEIKTDMAKWVKTPESLSWGIAISPDNITKVVKGVWSFNQPFFEVDQYSNYVVKKDLLSFNKYELEVQPGIYDWLILMDHNSDGLWDTYLGTAQEDIQLNELESEVDIYIQ